MSKNSPPKKQQTKHLKSAINKSTKLLAKQSIPNQHIQDCHKIITINYNQNQYNTKQQTTTMAVSLTNKLINQYKLIITLIDDRQKVIKQAIDLYVTIKQLPRTLINKIRQTSRILLKQLCQWVKIGQYNSNQKQQSNIKRFVIGNTINYVGNGINKQLLVYQDNQTIDYIQVFLSHNYRILDILRQITTDGIQQQYIFNDPNPLFIKNNQLTQPQTKQFLTKIESLIYIREGQSSKQMQQFKKIIKIQQQVQNSPSEDNKSPMEKTQELITKLDRDLEQFKQSQSIQQENKLRSLRKFRLMGGSPFKAQSSKMYHLRDESIKKQKKHNMSNDYSNMNKYYQRIQRLKGNIAKQQNKTTEKDEEIQHKLSSNSPTKITPKKSQSLSKIQLTSPMKTEKQVNKLNHTKIRLIAEKQHQNFKYTRKTELQRALQLTSGGIIHQKIPDKTIYNNNSSLALKNNDSIIKKPKSTKSINGDTIASHQKQKQKQLRNINKSLKDLKTKINNNGSNSTGYPLLKISKMAQSQKNIFHQEDPHNYNNDKSKLKSRTLNKHQIGQKLQTYNSAKLLNNKLANQQTKDIYQSPKSIQKQPSIIDNINSSRLLLQKYEQPQKQQKSSYSNSPTKKQQQNKANGQSEHQTIKTIKTINNIKEKPQQKIYKQNNQHKKQQLQQKQSNQQIMKMRKTSKLKKQTHNLQSIVEQIQNQNAQKENEISKQKSKIKSVEIKLIQKKHRIYQLQAKLRDYGSTNDILADDDNSSQNQKSVKLNNSQIQQLKNKKKQRIQKFQQQKDNIIKQVRGYSKRILSQQQKFIKLKQQQKHVDEEELRQKLQKDNKMKLSELEQETEKLKNKIQNQEKRRKANDLQLSEQLQRNKILEEEMITQEKLEKMLLDELERVNAAKHQRQIRRQQKQQEQLQKLRKQIRELQQTQKVSMMEYQRDSQALNSMYEVMRVKNIQLQTEIRVKQKVRLSQQNDSQIQGIN